MPRTIDIASPTAISLDECVERLATTGFNPADEGSLAHAALALGYAGWTAGQLEKEIEAGSWLSIPATQTLIFGTPHENMWDVAVGSLGFDLSHYSGIVGHA